MTPLQTLQAAPQRVLFIEGHGPLLPSARAYLSRSGQSVAVLLSPPVSPRHGTPLGKTHRVYLPLVVAAAATEPVHLLNAASHRAGKWLEARRNDYWHALVVASCVPLRGRCTSLLQAIARTARAHFGPTYWRHPDGRALLRRELALMGVSCPPDGPALAYLPLNG